MNKKRQTSQSFRLISPQIAHHCFAAIEQAVKEQDKHAVIVTIGIDDDKARSNAQNRLYWLWLHELETQTGQDDEWYHRYFKRTYLARIYAQDDGEFATMADSIKRCQGVIDNEHYERLVMGVIGQISTTKASTNQFSRYLKKIELWAYCKGLYLTTPDELAWAK